MSTPWSTSKWMLFLAIMLVALPGMGLSTANSPVFDSGSEYLQPVSVCNSETPVLLKPHPVGGPISSGQSLYWLIRGDPGSVMKMSKRTGQLQVLAERGPGSAFGFLVDKKSVFWAEATGPADDHLTLKKVDKRGRKVTELWQGTAAMRHLRMDRHNLYWLDYEADALFRLSKKGGEPEVLISSVVDRISNFSIVDGKMYFGGHEGLAVLERPGRMPRILITSEQLLEDLRISLRDERSLYWAGPVIAEYEDDILFVFSVANNPGLGSCNDNYDLIAALPKAGGKPHSILSVSGSLGYGSLQDAELLPPYLYTLGICQVGQVTNLDTGKKSNLNIGTGLQETWSLAVDRRSIYWVNREGLMCMRRPMN